MPWFLGPLGLVGSAGKRSPLNRPNALTIRMDRFKKAGAALGRYARTRRCVKNANEVHFGTVSTLSGFDDRDCFRVASKVMLPSEVICVAVYYERCDAHELSGTKSSQRVNE